MCRSGKKWKKDEFKTDFNLSNIFNSKKFKTVLISILCVIFFVPFFNSYLLPKLVIDSEYNTNWVDYFIYISLVIILLDIYVKYKNKYLQSFNQNLVFSLVVIFYFLVRCTADEVQFWAFKTFLLKGFYYQDVMIWLCIVYLVRNILMLQWIKKYKIKEVDKNNYHEDYPQDVSNKYQNFAVQLRELIETNQFKGSFSIGIVGKWGQGKTSYINTLKTELKKSEHKMIIINFSPFLNHKEEEVVHEFFTSLISKIGQFNGKLTKSISQYASSILKLYKRGDSDSLFNKNNILNNRSAFELYEEINEQIKAIDKKIIVFLDDIDRLNAKEIIQVLKLIRNTSNFTNTYFILAFDKEYVSSALIQEKSFIEINYLDKFFQLEIFLPEITKDELVDKTIELLKRSEVDLNGLSDAIRNDNTLFLNYIKSYRDVIKFVNQVLFDTRVLRNIQKEISGVDIVNLSLLKTRFPKVYFELSRNRTKFLEIDDNGNYKLKQKEENQKGDAIDLFKLLDQEYIPDFSNYQIDNTFKGEKIEYTLTGDEANLIKLTLFQLFESENISGNSIRSIRNFNKVFTMSYSDDDLLVEEYEDLLLYQDIQQLENKVENIINLKKSDQLLNLLEFHVYSDEQQIDRIIEILSICFSNNLDMLNLMRLFNKIVVGELNYANKKIILTKEKLTGIIKELISKEKIEIRTKINILQYIKIRLRNNPIEPWGYDIDTINNWLLKIWTDYLMGHDNLWDTNDYRVYQLYHEIKMDVDQEKMNETFVEYLKNNRIKVFLEQVLELEFNSYNLFTIARFVEELFGSYNDFESFFVNHIDKEEEYLKEFKQFYLLSKITSFRYLKFNFRYLNVKENDISEYEREQCKKIVQVFISIDESIANLPDLIPAIDGKKRSYPYENKEVIMFSTTRLSHKEVLENLYDHLQEKLKGNFDSNKSTTNFENFKLLNTDGLTLIEILSFQYD